MAARDITLWLAPGQYWLKSSACFQFTKKKRMFLHILSNDKKPTFSLVAMCRVESEELELELDKNHVYSTMSSLSLSVVLSTTKKKQKFGLV